MKAYLKPIRIGDGQFSNEKIVVIADYNGERLSGFFDDGFIKDGRLEVPVCAEKNDGSLIFTPKKDF